MSWYVIHTKSRQELRALQNLERQGYVCYLPTLLKKKIVRTALMLESEPLFARYLFIQLNSNSNSKSWAPIRSTLGVSRLLTFGNEPAKVPSELIQTLRSQEHILNEVPHSPFKNGDVVRILRNDAFRGVEAIYQMEDGQARAMVLIELLHRPTRVTVPITSLQKIF